MARLVRRSCAGKQILRVGSWDEAHVEPDRLLGRRNSVAWIGGRFSIAHSGKDRHRFPMPTTVDGQTIRVLKTAVANARLGREGEFAALKRLFDCAFEISAENHGLGCLAG
jgi:hypothetical protein